MGSRSPTNLRYNMKRGRLVQYEPTCFDTSSRERWARHCLLQVDLVDHPWFSEPCARHLRYAKCDLLALLLR